MTESDLFVRATPLEGKLRAGEGPGYRLAEAYHSCLRAPLGCVSTAHHSRLGYQDARCDSALGRFAARRVLLGSGNDKAARMVSSGPLVG